LKLTQYTIRISNVFPSLPAVDKVLHRVSCCRKRAPQYPECWVGDSLRPMAEQKRLYVGRLD
jgi:hypothetical protein